MISDLSGLRSDSVRRQLKEGASRGEVGTLAGQMAGVNHFLAIEKMFFRSNAGALDNGPAQALGRYRARRAEWPWAEGLVSMPPGSRSGDRPSAAATWGGPGIGPAACGRSFTLQQCEAGPQGRPGAKSEGSRRAGAPEGPAARRPISGRYARRYERGCPRRRRGTIARCTAEPGRSSRAESARHRSLPDRRRPPARPLRRRISPRPGR